VPKKDNVIPLPSAHWPIPQRVSEAITFEQFCDADALGEWADRTVVNGIIMLHYPRALMICCPMNCCSIVRQVGTDLSAYIVEALVELDQVA
jgi:hypothetical protein